MKPTAAELFESFVEAAREQFADDRDTIGELAGAVTRQADELGELRDELLEQSKRIDSLARTLDARTDRAA